MTGPKMLTGKEQSVINADRHVAEAFTRQIPAECWRIEQARTLRANLLLELKPNNFGQIELRVVDVSADYVELGKCKIDGTFYRAVMDNKEKL
jgi:hypothetical protein